MRGVAVVGPSGSGPSGIVVALVGGDGGRSMLTDRGTSALLAPADIDERFLDDVSWLFVSCYSLLAEPTIGAALRAVALARARGASIAVDIASRGAIEEVGVEGVLALVREINPDIVLATADELALVPAGAIALASLTVLKQGPRGAGLRGRINVDRPPCAGRVIDTLGAGDALTGGMLAALARGAHPVDALDAGMRAAASCVERRGAMPPVPGEPTA